MKNERLWDIDPWLQSFAKDIELRGDLFTRAKNRLLGPQAPTLSDFANGHNFFGFHQRRDNWVFREWAPAAIAMYLFGDFNDWNRQSHPLTRLPDGIWELGVPGTLPHAAKVRLAIVTASETLERLPTYSCRVVQDTQRLSFDAQIWAPPFPYIWNDGGFHPPTSDLLIYECHVGISGEQPRIATYEEFRKNLLPRVAGLGYNAIQLMGIMEHPYYGSFGYQVTNFFAVSSRFGTPEELKALIDTAHSLGVAVLLDLVHSHAAPNELEGLARFDGTNYQFFHKDARGRHPQWGTLLFDYAKPEVLHFLLSNLKFWLEEYHFDGFRFDGVTSMLYHDHALGGVFDNYRKYFSLNTDTDAVTYLQLATTLCREVKKDVVLIAEDMSGMPGMCLPIENDGIGFDYRLGMGLPDFWIRMLKTRPDEHWDTGALWHELSTRRPREKVIAYCESHDQALVGDKTIMFWLADQEMYWHMSKSSQSNAVDRAIALHKLIRLITCTCGGEAYLNFMGNEFGHPEWLDFPRAGNDNSYHYARRQWSLADNHLLRYHFLQDFDKAMLTLVKKHSLLSAPTHLLRHEQSAKVIVFTKAKFLLAFNFHPARDFELNMNLEGQPLNCLLPIVLDTCDSAFGGYKEKPDPPFAVRNGHLCLKLEHRSAVILKLID